MMYVEE
jgi:hypothetical protein